MDIKSFQIKNYKGIVDTTIDLTGGKGSIHTLVGLNESGKTTILEAINNFNFNKLGIDEGVLDPEGMHTILQKDLLNKDKETFVPKRKIRNFNDDIEIIATVIISDEEIDSICRKLSSENNIEINKDSFTRELTITRRYGYEKSRFKKDSQNWVFDVDIKLLDDEEAEEENDNAEEIIDQDNDDTDEGESAEFQSALFNRDEIRNKSGKDYWRIFAIELAKEFPSIVYFPTFLFNFPEKILLSEDNDNEFSNEQDKIINSYFRNVISEALRESDSELNLNEHIVDRVLNVEGEGEGDFLTTWNKSVEKEHVEAVISHLSDSITNQIFSVWNKVIKPNEKEKSALNNSKISLEINPLVSNGSRVVYLTLSIKDGSDQYSIGERSLGFRWFLSFLLFTKYFSGNKDGESIFLFDEPASNLHSMAQNKLIEVLKEIAGEKNMIIYTTHSHYMVHHQWLENTYVISNGGKIKKEEAIDLTYRDSSANIKAYKYRDFVGQHSDCPHYFQPILDSLRIEPIPIEARKGGVIVEGKSDFYILNWYKKHHGQNLDLDFIPVGGASKAGAMLTFYLGTMQDFVLLLDSDTAGEDAKVNYMKVLPIRDEQILEFESLLDGKKEIEDAISDDMKEKIKESLNARRFKKDMLIPVFAEDLFRDTPMEIDDETLDNLKNLTDNLLEKFKEIKF